MPHHDPAGDHILPMALAKMQEALRLLDEAGAPGDIGSHLDLAIAKLQARLGCGPRLAEAALLLSSLAVEPFG